MRRWSASKRNSRQTAKSGGSSSDTAAAKVDSITNRSQTQRATVVAKDVTQGTAVCNATRHRHQRCASVSGRLHCLPVQSCASCSPGLSGSQGGTGENVACLSAAVVRSRDPCAACAGRLSCVHTGSAAAPPPALPALIGCTAGRQRGVGVLLAWAAGLVLEGGSENRTGYCSPCRLGRSYIRLTSHVMMMIMLMMMVPMMLKVKPLVLGPVGGSLGFRIRLLKMPCRSEHGHRTIPS
jgi:hypothetical protein